MNGVGRLYSMPAHNITSLLGNESIDILNRKVIVLKELPYFGHIFS